MDFWQAAAVALISSLATFLIASWDRLRANESNFRESLSVSLYDAGIAAAQCSSEVRTLNLFSGSMLEANRKKLEVLRALREYESAAARVAHSTSDIGIYCLMDEAIHMNWDDISFIENLEMRSIDSLGRKYAIVHEGDRIRVSEISQRLMRNSHVWSATQLHNSLVYKKYHVKREIVDSCDSSDAIGNCQRKAYSYSFGDKRIIPKLGKRFLKVVLFPVWAPIELVQYMKRKNSQ